MRISSSLFFQTGVNTINGQQAGLMKLYQQIGSGKRLINPSDDPLASAQTINIAQSKTMNARYTENRQVAKAAIATEENTLTSVTSLLTSVKTRLVEAGNGTLSDADRAVLGNVLSNARDNLLSLANATDGNGQYLFSGGKGSQAPFVEVNGKISYQGDDGQRKIQVDQTRQLDSADTGRELFERPAPGTRNYLTSADAGNTGNAVLGSPSIVDSRGANVGDTFEIAFNRDSTTNKLTYSVKALEFGGRVLETETPVEFVEGTTSIKLFGDVQVKISGSPAEGDVFKVEPAFHGNPYKVDLDQANPIGSSATVGRPVISDPAGANVGKKLTVEFVADQPNAGEFGFRVTPEGGTTPATWTLMSPTNPAALPVGYELDLGGGVKIQLEGSPASPSQFVLEPVSQPMANLNVFDTLDSLIEVLNIPSSLTAADSAGFQNRLNATMQRIDVTYSQVLTVRSSVGSRLNEIQSIDDNASLRNLSYSQELIRLEDLDWYEATAQLQMQTAALEAASLAFKQIQATSLFRISNG